MAEDYVRALRGKAVIAAEVDRALAGVDALACPTLSIPAPPIGATTMPVRGGADSVRALMLRCTQPFNVSGHPAIALPCGATPDGLPTSLQLVGHRSETPALLQTPSPSSARSRRLDDRAFFHHWEQQARRHQQRRSRHSRLRLGSRLDSITRKLRFADASADRRSLGGGWLGLSNNSGAELLGRDR